MAAACTGSFHAMENSDQWSHSCTELGLSYHSGSEPSSPETEMRYEKLSPCTTLSNSLLSHHDHFFSYSSDGEPGSPVLQPLSACPLVAQNSCVVRRLNFDHVKQESTLNSGVNQSCKIYVDPLKLEPAIHEVKQESPLDEGRDQNNPWLVSPHSGLLMSQVSESEMRVKLGAYIYDIDLETAGDLPIPDVPAYEYSTYNAVHNDNNNNCIPTPVYMCQNNNTHPCDWNRGGQTLPTCGSSDRRAPDAQEEFSYPGGTGGCSKRRQAVTRTERLWEFILRLLGDSQHNPRLIEWVERDDGTFRLNNSKAIALMWGMRKNNEQMTYEKLSRALRYYYHRQILEPVLGKKLVYRFGPKATQVWDRCPYRSQNGVCYSQPYGSQRDHCDVTARSGSTQE